MDALLNDFLLVEPCIRWGQFISISDCSVTCGGGQQSFTRNCINGNPGDVGCEGLTFETRLCNSQICPPEWSPWSEFSSCSSDCNGGEKSRTRYAKFTLLRFPKT